MPLPLAALLAWLLMFALAAASGALREFVLVPLIGAAAQPVSGVLLIVLVGAVAVGFARRYALTVRAASLAGLGFLALTLAAETAMIVRAGGPVSGALDMFSWFALARGELFALAATVAALGPIAAAALDRRAAVY